MKPAFVALLACLLLASPGAAPAHATEAGVTETTFENGLRVAVRPVKGADKVAICTLFDIGEDHDPAGRSGLAHLIEHLYVTAAAGETEARTAEDMMARYPQAWNAQTGARYTVAAFVVPKARLEAELLQAASRMAVLDITAEDLARELPRIRLELANMHARLPMLATRNRARAMVRPPPPGALKGGRVEELAEIPLHEIQRHHRLYYKPRNARLILAGDVEPEAALAAVRKVFERIPSGEAALPARTPGKATGGEVVVLPRPDTATPGHVAWAWPTPAVSDPDFPAFLVLNALLMQASMRTRGRGMQTEYMLFDAPGAIVRTRPATDGDAEVTVADGVPTDALPERFTPLGRHQIAQWLGFFLGGTSYPDAQLAFNLYGLAFGVGRRAQMGFDGTALAQAIQAVTPADVVAVRDRVFAPARGACAIVRAP